MENVTSTGTLESINEFIFPQILVYGKMSKDEFSALVKGCRTKIHSSNILS